MKLTIKKLDKKMLQTYLSKKGLILTTIGKNLKFCCININKIYF